MKRTLIFIVAFFFVNFSFGTVCAEETKNKDDLMVYSPRMEGLTPDDSPQRAEGMEGLFAAINGGAEVYIQYGFKRALFQTYKTKNNRLFNFEIFEMNNADAAQNLYLHKTEGVPKKIKIGDQAVLADYYLIFRKGRFYVSLTGFDSDKETRDDLVAVAKAVEQRIEKNSK